MNRIRLFLMLGIALSATLLFIGGCGGRATATPSGDVTRDVARASSAAEGESEIAERREVEGATLAVTKLEETDTSGAIFGRPQQH